MTRAWLLLLTLALAAPAAAQDEPPPEESADVVPVEEPAAEAAAEEPAPVEEAATGEPPVDDTATAEAPAEETPAEEAPVDEAAAEREPWRLYAGLDYVVNTLSTSGANGAGDEFDTGMYRLRFGRRVFESVGLEFHYGVDNSDDGPTDVETDSYYGLFIVPTATLFETLELAFPVGYARTSLGSGDAGQDFDSMGYGADLELPLRAFGEALPDLRLTAGGMVYYQKSDARLYGVNLGLRYDFTAAGLGNPFSGLDLWPFGDDEDTPAAE